MLSEFVAQPHCIHVYFFIKFAIKNNSNQINANILLDMNTMCCKNPASDRAKSNVK